MLSLLPHLEQVVILRIHLTTVSTKNIPAGMTLNAGHWQATSAREHARGGPKITHHASHTLSFI